MGFDRSQSRFLEVPNNRCNTSITNADLRNCFLVRRVFHWYCRIRVRRCGATVAMTEALPLSESSSLGAKETVRDAMVLMKHLD